MALTFLETLFLTPADRKAQELLRHRDKYPDSCDVYTFYKLISSLAEASSQKIKLALAREMHKIVGQELAKPDISPCWFYGFFDHSLRQYESCRNAVPDEYLTSFLILASQENNGYIRERAVREWKTHPSPLAVRFLIDRLADWVAPVRDTAWDSIRTYMTPEYLHCFLERFYWIDRLLGKGNPDSIRYGTELVDFVFSFEFTAEVERHLKDRDRRNWNCYVKHSIQRSLASNSLLQEVVRKDSSPTVRSSVIRILDELPEQTGAEILEEMLRDSAQPVRSRANYYVVKHLDRPGYERLTYIAASDYSPSIREAARFYLRDQDVDWRQYYFLRINGPSFANFLDGGYGKRQMLGNLGGYCEFATEQDIPFLEQILQIPEGKGQSLALEAIYKLDSRRGIKWAKKLLQDHTGYLGRCCANLLAKDSSLETLMFARSIVHCESYRLRVLGLKLLEKLGGWGVAADLLAATADTDSLVRDKAASLLQQWIRKFSGQSHVNPGDEETQRVVEAAALARSRKAAISPETIKTVLFFFGVR